MQLDDFINRKSGWLKSEGSKSDIAISTRIRIARNLTKHHFFNWANEREQEATLEEIMKAVERIKEFQGALFLRMDKLSEVDKQFLIERHLMSREHGVDAKHKALVVNQEEIASVMVNEEDHIRLQVLRPGCDLVDAWRITDGLDTKLNSCLNFAYSNRFGFLTSCPTNTGSGLRASVMMHLPALAMTVQMDNVYEAISKLGLTIRGFYGEGTEATGNFFQISNQVSLGHSEMDIIDNLERVINKIVLREEGTRTFLLDHKKKEVTDSISRSYGTLKSARIITSRETIKLLSSIRLGVDLGIITEVTKDDLNDLLLFTQPAHLQKVSRKELDPYERDVKRADLIREKLGAE